MLRMTSAENFRDYKRLERVQDMRRDKSFMHIQKILLQEIAMKRRQTKAKKNISSDATVHDAYMLKESLVINAGFKNIGSTCYMGSCKYTQKKKKTFVCLCLFFDTVYVFNVGFWVSV